MGEGGAEPVLFPDISYSFYPVFANLWGVPYRSVPLRGDFSLETADFDVPNSGVIFPNPNAPTGMALSAAAVVQAAQFQAERKRVLIVDEAYIAFGGESVVPFTADFDNLLVTQTFSKAASLAGLRVGYAIGNAHLIEGLERIRDSFNSYPVDTLAAAAATAAVKATDYYTMINSRIMRTRERAAAALRKKGWLVLPSQSNFIFASPPAADKPAKSAETGAIGAANITGDARPYYEALRKKGILVRHFAAPRTKAFLRISIGTDEEMDIFLAACED